MMPGADPSRRIGLRLAASLLALIAGIAAVVIVIELVRTTLG
jgi:hypothetical protein